MYLVLIVALITLYLQDAQCIELSYSRDEKSDAVGDVELIEMLMTTAFRDHEGTTKTETHSRGNLKLTITTLAGGKCFDELKYWFDKICYKCNSYVYTECGISTNGDTMDCTISLTKN
jgi:hypothetical protein